MLDLVLGSDRFDKHPVDIEELALQYSSKINALGPISEISARNLPGCMGALVFGNTLPRQWGILYNLNQSKGRKAFTVAHEFGHYVLHRSIVEKMDDKGNGIYCDENSVLRRAGEGIEKEADEFAASVLMPFHDFRRQLPANIRPDFNRLQDIASRYGVSLTATILRWLEYTETRAIMVVSNEGFAHWSKPSCSALKTGRFIRTKNVVYELPTQAIASRKEYTEQAKIGIQQSAGVWFPEPVVEMCIRSDRYDQEITLLHFEKMGPVYHASAKFDDSYDLFVKRGQV